MHTIQNNVYYFVVFCSLAEKNLYSNLKVVTKTEFLQNVDPIFPEMCVHKKRNCPNRDHCLIFLLYC